MFRKSAFIKCNRLRSDSNQIASENPHPEIKFDEWRHLPSYPFRNFTKTRARLPRLPPPSEGRALAVTRTLSLSLSVGVCFNGGSEHRYRLLVSKRRYSPSVSVVLAVSVFVFIISFSFSSGESIFFLWRRLSWFLPLFVYMVSPAKMLRLLFVESCYFTGFCAYAFISFLPTMS